MANCAKCSAELIGSAKFCATCGVPVVRPSGAEHLPTPGGAGPSGYGPLNSQVNPFAATASPISKKAPSGPPPPVAGAAEPTTTSAPPPPPRQPSAPPLGVDGSQVSPLAVSNALMQRGAFQQVVESAAQEKARLSVTPPPAPVRGKKPGTQLMPTAPNRSLPGSAEGSSPQPPAANEATPPAKKAVPRTVAMNFAAKPPTPSPNSAPSTTPSPGAMPPSVAAGLPPTSGGAAYPPPAPYVQQPPPAVVPPQPAPYSQQTPPAAYPQQAPFAQQPPSPAYPQQMPFAQQAPAAAAGGWGRNVPAAQPPQTPGAFQYPFGYSAGSRVHVTWSNGQRYPATVSQVSGSQCLVVFPDGQQHWVEMMYLSPNQT